MILITMIVFFEYFDSFKQPKPNLCKIFKCVHKQHEKIVSTEILAPYLIILNFWLKIVLAD